jgi:tetratricopeptide (TPR) repeat protein
LVNNNENDDEEEEILADIEDCKQSAKAILSSATTVMEQWSTTGSELGLELGVAKREELEQWVEELHISNSSSSYPKSDSTVEDTVSATSELTEPVIMRDERGPRPSHKNWTEEELSVREDLISEGIVEFCKGEYYEAHGCFRRAYDLGLITHSPGNPTSDTGNEALMLWTCLTTLRWSNVQQLPLSEFLRQEAQEMLKGADYFASTIDPKLNWLLANIHLELGKLPEAERRCQLAVEHFPRNQRLPPKNDGVYIPGDYDDVLLTMVAILYAQHSIASAKFWKAKVSARSLLAKGTHFFVIRGESKPPSELKISTAIKQQNFTAALWLNPYPSSHFSLDFREAIKAKSFPLLSMIVDHCKGSNSRDSALHEAVEQGNLPAVEFLLEAGLKIDSTLPGYSCTPLGLAICRGQLVISEFLLQKGASLTTTEAPLYFAITSPLRKNTIPLLLKYGADVNADWTGGRRPLSVAVLHSGGSSREDGGGDNTLVRMLVEAGADVNKPSMSDSKKYGSLTPLELARKLKFHNVEKYLLEAGAKDKHGRVPSKPACRLHK